MPESKKAAEFQNRHEQIMKMIKKMGDYPRVLPVRPVRPTSTGSLQVPRVLPTIPVRSASMGNSGVRPQTPYYNHPSNIRTSTPYPKEESHTPRSQTPYYSPHSNKIREGTPYPKEESHQRRSQTPYYNQRPSNMIRTGTPYQREEPRPVFSSDLQKKRTVKDLTNFFEKFINNNTRGGKYSKNKVGKKSKRVVKANKK